MIYADYDYYLNEYYGRAIQAKDFMRLALHGSQYIDYITRGRASARGDLEAVKMCCCALAEQYQGIDAAVELARESLAAGAADGGVEVSSETVGSWSRTYRSRGEIAQAAAQLSAQAEEAGRSALLDTARRYLAPTGLLYRGGGRCR